MRLPIHEEARFIVHGAHTCSSFLLSGPSCWLQGKALLGTLLFLLWWFVDQIFKLPIFLTEGLWVKHK